MTQVPAPKLSLVVPVYRNEKALDALLSAVRDIQQQAGEAIEVVFVVDGSPDRSYAVLCGKLPGAGFASQLISLSRNFGSFSAIRVGLEQASGRAIAVMAADLQEPPELVLSFWNTIRQKQADVVFGVREGRRDPIVSRVLSSAFWGIYRRFVMQDVPKGGVDMFAVTDVFRDRLMALRESNTSLLAQLFWLGGRREFVSYERRERQQGQSGWTLGKKLRYLSDSVFAFTDLPVRLLIYLGVASMAVAMVLAFIVLVAKFSGWLEVPGYAGTILTILFFGAFNSLGLGVVGTYAWRAFENTKGRPLAVVQSVEHFQGHPT
ncbi:MAG: glycosyltransferase family 2 protein [Pseudomonadota bacterium]|nr:glycosyltransferase family 2 protein [Pseudomonadota bacterium]